MVLVVGYRISVSDHRYQIEISLHTVIHTLLCGSISLILEDVSSKLPSTLDLDRSFDFLVTVMSGLVSRFTDLGLTQTSAVTRKTDPPQLGFKITEMDHWGALTTSQLFNQLDRYLRPKSLQKMRREERESLVIILCLVFIGVCSTPPPTRKTAQESLDSLKQALLAYIRYIAPNIPLPDSQPNCYIYRYKIIWGRDIKVGYQNLNLSTGNTRSGIRALVWITYEKGDHT